MTAKAANGHARNAYECAIEMNQNGKYCVRIRANFGRPEWSLALYFLASSFDRAMKKLEHTLQYLQEREESLWFWGADRSDDPNLIVELLADQGLRRDRRMEFPRKHAQIQTAPKRPVPAFQIAPARRVLAESLTPARVASD